MGSESPQSDIDLLESVRNGNAAAYGELYKRHVTAARQLARQIVRDPGEVEDVVADSFTKILDLVGRGRGPEAGFRPYLLTVVRHTIYGRARVGDREVSTGEIEEFDPGTPFVDPALAGLEKSLIARAFLALPDRWRMVLWHTEVEKAKPADVAPLLGLSANGVAALAYRAREGLRQAYLQVHLAGSPQPDCRPVIARMGAYVRGGLARRDTSTVDAHLSDCTECRSVYMELADVNQGLRVIVGPLIVGPVFAAYLAGWSKTAPASRRGRPGGCTPFGWIVRLPKLLQASAAGSLAVVSSAVLAMMLASGQQPLGLPLADEPDGPSQPQAARPAAVRVPPVSIVDAHTIGSDDTATPGSSREPGSAGKPGSADKPGSASEPGSADKSGSAGKSGSSASSGSPGTSGPSRDTGTSGSPGKSNPPATSGSPGKSGPSGTPSGSGSAGKPGSGPAVISIPPGPSGAPADLGKALLSASVDPIGSLVRSSHGIVGFRLSNDGKAPSEDLVAAVTLPKGVTARHGKGVSLTTPDGWACRPTRPGAICSRGPLGAGRQTSVFLQVKVASEAPESTGPAVRITGGDSTVKAQAGTGVRGSGVPARFATDGRVSVTAIGNTLLTCPDLWAGCGETRLRKGNRRDNDLWPMARLDADEMAVTDSSSAAVLNLPEDSQVLWAGLYWSASGSEAGPIAFRTPGRKKYMKVKADEVTRHALPTGNAYQAFADVTDLVDRDERRKGQWWAADAPMREGISQYAGWSLVVVAGDRHRPYSQAMVVDGAAVVGATGTAGLVGGTAPGVGKAESGGDRSRLRVPLGGLSPAGTTARVALVSWEGDADLGGDKLTLGAEQLTPVGGDKDDRNIFDSSSTGTSELTFGMDVDAFDARLGEEPVLELTTTRDAVLFGVAAVSVPVSP